MMRQRRRDSGEDVDGIDDDPIRGGMIQIPKNRNSGSMGYFGGIGTRIGIKGIVKGIKKESFSDSNSSFHEQAEGIAIHNLRRNRSTPLRSARPRFGCTLHAMTIQRSE